MSSVQILAAIQSLESQLAMLKSMVQGPSEQKVVAEPVKAKKEKKEKDPDAPKKEVSEGVRLWNILIAETLEEMKAAGWTHPETGKAASRKDAMTAASAHKKGGKSNAAAAPIAPPSPSSKKPAATPPSPQKAEESGAESDGSKGSKRGPAKGSHWSEEAKAAAKAKREAKKLAKKAEGIPSLPPSPEESAAEEDEVMVKKVLSGKTYFISPKTQAAYHDGVYKGIYDEKSKKINTEVVEPAA
jgi:hypothetical protein